MAFLVYYHIAKQTNNIVERDRAAYFAALTQSFVLNVFEKPQQYWNYPPFVGTYAVGAVFDSKSRPEVQWDWAKTIWSLWTPVMSTSYTPAYVNHIREAAERDWDWNRPEGRKFVEEYLNFNMILFYISDPEAKQNVKILLQLYLTSDQGRRLCSASGSRATSCPMRLSEEAAQIVYSMLTPPTLHQQQSLELAPLGTWWWLLVVTVVTVGMSLILIASKAGPLKRVGQNRSRRSPRRHPAQY
jgi:hypothetical protein